MEVISELVLGKADPGLREPEIAFDFASATGNAELIESLGYDGIMATETKDDPFLMLTGRQRDYIGRPVHCRCHCLPAIPDVDGHDSVGDAEAIPRPLHVRPGLAGIRSYQTPLRYDASATRTVDARLRRCGTRSMGLLAERDATQLRERTIQPQLNGPVV